MISRTHYTTLLIMVAIIAIPSTKAHNPMNVFFKTQANEIFKNKKQSLMLLLGDFDQSSSQFSAVSSITDDYPNMLFTYSRKGIDPYDKLIELVGVYKMTPPMIIYFSSAGDKHLYQIEKFGDFAQSSNIKKFIEQAKKGGLPNFFKSGYSRQDIPDQQRAENEKYMKYYNAFTLQQERRNSKKDLIVVVYAFWCMYSQKFAPVFRDIAKALAVNPNLQFGKIDGGDNEIKGFEAAGYPTLLMWGKDKQKEPRVYFGNRKIGDVINWIKQNSEHPWVDYIEPEQEQQEPKIQKISGSDQIEQQQQYEQFQQEIQQQEL